MLFVLARLIHTSSMAMKLNTETQTTETGPAWNENKAQVYDNKTITMKTVEHCRPTAGQLRLTQVTQIYCINNVRCFQKPSGLVK